MSTESVLQNSTRAVGGVPQKPPVLGGSGRQYWTIRDALAGEAALAVTVAAVVPQAGTQAGTVVFQAGQSAVNDFYKDQFVLDTDTTPTNGLVSQFARISSYIGASRTATIDKPWDFSAESTVSIIQPARISLQGDVEEDVTITIPVDLDLQGHRIRGKVDVTGGNFCRIRGGSGSITNGIQKTDFGLLTITECTVSRRDATIYSILLTEGNNLGRCELMNVRSYGTIAGRRGYSGWMITNCDLPGVTSGTVNEPCRLVESLAGISITFNAIDAYVDGQFGGSFFYSENNITGAANYMSIHGNIRSARDYYASATSPRKASIIKAVGGATVTLTSAGPNGSISVTVEGFFVPNSLSDSNYQIFSIVDCLNYTGTCSFTISGNNNFSMLGATFAAGILIEGTSDMTGSVTLAGGAQKNIFASNSSYCIIQSRVRFTGSITASGGAHVVQGGGNGGGNELVALTLLGADQNAGAPTITISCDLVVFGAQSYDGTQGTGGGGHVYPNGTYTFSGDVLLRYTGATSLVSLASGATGATWVFSGQWQHYHAIIGPFTPGTSSANPFNHNGTGGTATVSGNVRIDGCDCGQFILARAQGAGATLNVTSATIIVRDVRFNTATNCISAVTATSVVSVTGAVIFHNWRCDSGTFTILNSNAVGASATGPTSLNIDYGMFQAVTTQSGTGTLAWGASAALNIRHSTFLGVFTIVGTPFTTLEAFHSRFNGASSNKSISASGTRPTTYRYWSCSAAQRFDDLLPEWMVVYDVLPAQAALVQGQPVFVNNANQYKVCVAGSIVDGVLLAAAGGAGTFAVCVRHGRVFIAAKAGTANGDNLALDLVTPTQTNLAAFTPGQNVGTALEAVGTTVAGKSYAAVNVR